MSDVEWERRDRQATAAAARLNYSLSLSLCGMEGAIDIGRERRRRGRIMTAVLQARRVSCARAVILPRRISICVCWVTSSGFRFVGAGWKVRILIYDEERGGEIEIGIF